MRNNSFKYSIKALTSFCFLFFATIACEIPIELNFPASDAKLVVDGFITNVEKEHLVRLSYSSGFNRDGIHLPDRIDNAFVEVVDNMGKRTRLVYRELGDYYTPMFKAESNRVRLSATSSDSYCK